MEDSRVAVESVCSSGYESNGTSEIALSNPQEDACSSRSGSVSTSEETPDYGGPNPSLAILNGGEDTHQNPTMPQTNGTVVRRPKASVDKLTALSAHRSSCPTSLIVAEQLNLSFGSAHSSSSNISIERLTGTGSDEVRQCYIKNKYMSLLM